MRNIPRLTLVIGLVAVSLTLVIYVVGIGRSGVSSRARAAAADLGNVGRVSFPVTSAPGIQPDFDHAVAVLHSFFYEESEREFAAITERDPRCAMAWWGVAMSLWHPLWEPPDSVSLKRGWDAVQRAEAIGFGSERERAYVAALATFYRDWRHADHRTRAAAYERAMQQLSARFPEDLEAAAFHALALDATADPRDKTYARQRRALAILEPLYVRHPDHPGIVHYLIHSCDAPPLAERALPAARHYAEIAPRVPHALHMPAHIFTRLGMWDECILSNLAAAQAGREYAAAVCGGGAYYDEVHAFDYLEYAYLQKGQDVEARAIRDSVLAIRRVSRQTLSFFYALASVPSRYALERRDWRAAAELRLPPGWDWSRYPWTEATLQYARALGGARSGRLEVAREAAARLEAIRKDIKDPKLQYWARQVDVQRRVAASWLAFAEGRREAALTGMQAAAAIEDSSEKLPVTPGSVLPARELLGDMLMELRLPAEALEAYTATLETSPRRLYALAGAQRAAEACGRHAAARECATQLLAVAKDADGERLEVGEARRLLRP
ncbi:MAG: hypothetical protein HZB25_05010 [Candidatus Eisenbacteria bacterium]|nr:hypothetical protein [Candidatus Eisenbacteria bacterium]